MTRHAGSPRFVGNDGYTVRTLSALAAVALCLAVTGFILGWFT
jgi:hypothetical protein